MSSEIFLGLSDTAWTAISSIATVCAVLVALYFPVSDRFSRKQKIYRTIEAEIRRNISVLGKAKGNYLGPIVGAAVPRSVTAAFQLRAIDLSYWDDNRQFVSETSLKRYSQYSSINNDLRELKLLVEELINTDTDIRTFDKVIIALEMTYEKILKTGAIKIAELKQEESI